MILLNYVHPWQRGSEPLLGLTLVYHFAQIKKKKNPTHNLSRTSLIHVTNLFLQASSIFCLFAFFPLRRLESDLTKVKDIYLLSKSFAVLNQSEFIVIICFLSTSADIKICSCQYFQRGKSLCKCHAHAHTHLHFLSKAARHPVQADMGPFVRQWGLYRECYVAVHDPTCLWSWRGSRPLTPGSKTRKMKKGG